MSDKTVDLKTAMEALAIGKHVTHPRGVLTEIDKTLTLKINNGSYDYYAAPPTNGYTIVEPEPEIQYGPMRVKPKDGNKYITIIDANGGMLLTTWRDDRLDNVRFSIGNVFATEAAAWHEVERRKVFHELWCQPGARGYSNNGNRDNYTLHRAVGGWTWGSDNSPRSNLIIPYFNTSIEVLDAINAITPERLNVLLKG